MSLISAELDAKIASLVYCYETPQRIALSKKHPFLKKPILHSRQAVRSINNLVNYKIKRDVKVNFLTRIIARHQSLLRRKLGDSSLNLQEQKITNLKMALPHLNGLVFNPGDIFSFWDVLGKPKYKNGYVDGMLLADGKVTMGIGGGLCQLSNFLFWIFLHTQVQIIERHHHQIDAFPDSGRVLPFGGGATVFYNFIDLKLKNISKYPMQLKIWLTDNHLKGQILSTHPAEEKFHIVERNHYFIKRGEKYFRYNEIYKETKVNGEIKKIERIITNFAPVVYSVNDSYLKQNNYQVLDYSGRNLTA